MEACSTSALIRTHPHSFGEPPPPPLPPDAPVTMTQVQAAGRVGVCACSSAARWPQQRAGAPADARTLPLWWARQRARTVEHGGTGASLGNAGEPA